MIDGRPGFTNETLNALKFKVRNTDVPILYNLVVDEVSIRRKIDYNENRYYGYVNLEDNNCMLQAMLIISNKLQTR